MQPKNPFFDDLSRVAGGALGALSGLKAEFEALVKQQMERFTAGMDLVTREEFEVVRALAAKARDEQEALAARVAALEAKLGEVQGAQPAAEKAAKPKAARASKPKDQAQSDEQA